MSGDLHDIVSQVWKTTLDSDIVPVAEQAVGQQSLAGIVQISGEWYGAVVLVGSVEMARLAAAVMFNTDVDHVDRDDMADAWGELSNIVAGLIKTELRGGNDISLPIVIQGVSYNLGVLGCNVLFSQTYRCGDALFSMALFERRPSI
jgi:CheY-specific phosphatase CheX